MTRAHEIAGTPATPSAGGASAPAHSDGVSSLSDLGRGGCPAAAAFLPELGVWRALVLSAACGGAIWAAAATMLAALLA